MIKKSFFTLFLLLRAVRHALLLSVFGVVSHCKHKPSCGTYTLQAIKKEGWLRGTSKGLLRIARCW